MRILGVLVLCLLPQQDKLPTEPVVDWRYEIESADRTGRRELVAVIRGKEAKPVTADRYKLVDPNGEYYTRKTKEGRPSQKITFRAPEGLYDRRKETLRLTRGATMNAEDGAQVKLDEMVLDFKSRTFVTDGDFHFRRHDAKLRGTGLTADDEMKTVEAKKNAVLNFRGEPRAILKGEVDSDSILSRLTCAGPMTIRELPSNDPENVRFSEVVARNKCRLEREHVDGLIVTTCDQLTMQLRTVTVDGKRDVQMLQGRAIGGITIRQGDAMFIRGETAHWNRNDDLFHMTSPKGVTAVIKGMNVRADRAEVNRAGMIARFIGNVTIDGVMEGQEEPMNATASLLQWDVANERGFLQGEPMVVLIQGDQTVEATRVALVGQGLAILQGRKRIQAKQEDQILHITCAGDAIYDTTLKIVILVDRCRVRTDDFTILCDRMRVFSEGPIMEAAGNVRIKRHEDDMTLYADSMRYDSATDLVFLRGRPHVIGATPDSAHYWKGARFDVKTKRLDAWNGNSFIDAPEEKKK